MRSCFLFLENVFASIDGIHVQQQEPWGVLKIVILLLTLCFSKST